MSETKKKIIKMIENERNPKYLFLTRRTFMKGTLAAGTALAIAGCGTQETQAPAPKEEPKQEAQATATQTITSPHYIAVDYEKCVGCRICEVECAMFHNDGVPDLTKSNIKVYYYNPPVDIPSLCAHCNDSPCLTACPEKVGALTKDEVTGAIIIDDEKCIACWDCLEPCAKDRTGILRASKDGQTVNGFCDLCDGDPQCVKACPEEALSLVPVYMHGEYFAAKPEDIAKSIAKIMYRGNKEV